MSYKEAENALLVNRLNSSRLAVHGSSLSDGAYVISVRYTSHDKNPQRWTTKKIGEESGGVGWTIVHIEISDGDKTYRLDAGSDEPEVDPGSQVRIAEPNGSDQQKWCVREDAWSNALNFAPYLNRGAGLGLRDHFGNHSHDEAVLVRNFSGNNQLWYWNGSSYHDIIPN